MKQFVLIISCFLYTRCAQVAQAESSSIKISTTETGGKIVSNEFYGYYFLLDSSKTDDSLKLELHNRIKGHRVIKYTENSSAIPSGYDFTTISDNLIFISDLSTTVPVRFDVWDYFTGIALKNANSRGVTCPAKNRVYDVYSGYCYIPAGKAAATAPATTYDIPQLFNHTSANDQASMNREHAWPNSWFKNATAVNDPATGNYCFDGNNDSNYNNYNDYRAFTDIHALLPTESSSNQIGRADYPYGITTAPTISYSGAGAKQATPNTGGRQGPPNHSSITQGAYASCGTAADQVPCAATVIFDPPDHMKGDIARIYFYMATRYYTEDSCWRDDLSPSPPLAVNKANIKTWQEKMLRKWHNDDPVDDGERAKNDLIHRIQGNRNPFIDHPEWVAKISDF